VIVSQSEFVMFIDVTIVETGHGHGIAEYSARNSVFMLIQFPE
jgi:hypothetical protein